MCTSITSKFPVSGSAKGPAGWTPVTTAVVYFDHPQHASEEHALSLDFLGPAGPCGRVAVELGAESARALARAIDAALAAGREEGLL
jgi:hypothetical protein